MDCWRSTPAELAVQCEGAREREQRDRQRDAWILANLLQPWSKQRLRAEDFYKPDTPTSSLTKRQKTEEFLRRLEAQGQITPEHDNA